MYNTFYLIEERVQQNKSSIVSHNYFFKNENDARDFYNTRFAVLSECLVNYKNAVTDFDLIQSEVNYQQLKNLMTVQEFEKFFNIQLLYNDIFGGSISIISNNGKDDV